MNQLEKIKALKEYAMINYSKGMDYFIECYTEAEWLEFIGDMSITKAKKQMRDDASMRAEAYSNCW